MSSLSVSEDAECNFVKFSPSMFNIQFWTSPWTVSNSGLQTDCATQIDFVILLLFKFLLIAKLCLFTLSLFRSWLKQSTVIKLSCMPLKAYINWFFSWTDLSHAIFTIFMSLTKKIVLRMCYSLKLTNYFIVLSLQVFLYLPYYLSVKLGLLCLLR